MRCGKFPVWCYLHDRSERFFYGLPEFGPQGSGVKLARHRTTGENEDPNAAPSDPLAELDKLREFAANQFTYPIKRLASFEHCLYSNTSNEDFIVDFHPEDRRIAFASACSGHGFKFGPLIGRVLTELLLDGSPQSPAFASTWPRFQLHPR